MKTRYSLTGTFYIWAKDDNEAKRKAEEWRHDEDRDHDNSPVVQSLVCRPFASLEWRELKGLDGWLDETAELKAEDFPTEAEAEQADDAWREHQREASE